MEQTRASQDTSSWLDRPVWGRITGWHLVYAAILVFILFTRLWDLGSRPYDHDESIHAWESWQLIMGQGYRHDPVYHGPFLYHFTGLLFGLFGDTDYVGRLSPALSSIVLVLLPLCLQRWLGKRGVLMATLLMAISPVVMCRSRYLRHDQNAIVFNLLMLIAMMRYLERPQVKHLYLFAAALALGLTAKETTFITYAIFGTFLFLYYLQQVKPKSANGWLHYPVVDLMILMVTLLLPFAAAFPIKLLGGDPVDYQSSQALMLSGGVTLALLLLGTVIGVWWGRRWWAVSAAIFWVIILTLFTTLFTNGQGIATGVVGQLGYWLSQQGVKRGGQPWYYYLALFPLYEFLPILLGIGGAIWLAIRSWRGRSSARAASPNAVAVYGAEAPAVVAESAAQPAGQSGAESATAPAAVPLLPLLLYWSVAALVLYSWAGEKMPWLMLHLAVPLQLFAGWALAELLPRDWRAIKRAHGLWLLALLPAFGLVLVQLATKRPTRGTSLAELGQTGAWFGALVAALALAGLIHTVAKRLTGRQVGQMVGTAAVMVLMAVTVRFAWMATFTNAALASEFLVYAQAAPDVAIVNQELRDLSYRLTGGLHLKVAYDDESSWPWVWYFRNFDQAVFYGQSPNQPFDADVVIVGPGNEAAVKPFLGNRYFRREYRLIWWPNQDWYMSWQNESLWAKLRDPKQRKAIWRVVWFRDYEQNLEDWPYVHNFILYVQRDIAKEVWDYGPESLSALEPQPGDDYAEKWVSREASAVIGGPGEGPGQLLAPKGLALDSAGQLYVADSQHHRIQVFDAQGQFVRQWGYQGGEPGQFQEPWGVAVGANGEVYVADTWNHRIQVFDAKGTYLREWGQFGEAANPQGPDSLLYGPRAIVCADDGTLWVADTGNKRVIHFDP
ncbi:MAG: flippase activity-associated protein Agl23, partial [Anaerolineales bacterium]